LLPRGSSGRGWEIRALYQDEHTEFQQEIPNGGKWASFVEHEDGSLADKLTVQQMRHIFKKSFDYLCQHGEARSVFGDLSPGAEAYVISEAIDAHPYLAYGAGLWKPTKLGSKLYSDYASRHGLVDLENARGPLIKRDPKDASRPVKKKLKVERSPHPLLHRLACQPTWMVSPTDNLLYARMRR
jgi:hypothetical protein